MRDTGVYLPGRCERCWTRPYCAWGTATRVLGARVVGVGVAVAVIHHASLPNSSLPTIFELDMLLLLRAPKAPAKHRQSKAKLNAIAFYPPPQHDGRNRHDFSTSTVHLE